MNYATWKSVHSWLGLVLLLPVMVIAATGFLWNHEKSLGIKQEYKNKEGKPPGTTDASDAPMLTATTGIWQSHGDAIDNAIAAARETWGGELPLERIELKEEPGYGVVVKVKAHHDSGVMPEEVIWSASLGEPLTHETLHASGADWAKLVHDLHTGKFFSREWGFFWSDSGSIAILVLGVSGVVLFALPRLKKRANRRRKSQTAAASPPPARVLVDRERRKLVNS